MKPVRGSSAVRPRILVVGPRPTQVGGLGTFIDIFLSSVYMRERYELIQLDITRGPRGAGEANRFRLINFVYFLRQAMQFGRIVIRDRPVLLHVPLNSFWAFWKDAAFVLMARMMGMKVVAHLHGGLFARFYRQSPPSLQRLIGWVMCTADVVIALSQSWKGFLLGEVRPDMNIEVIPNTVDSMFAHALDNTGDDRERRANRVLFVGRLGHAKGVFDILKAVPLVVERRPEVCFLFVGTEERNGVGAQIAEVCARTRLNSAVQFLGQVTGQAKLDLFLEASVFILPSYGENLPFVLLEAMCTGLPIVTTAVGGIPELVEDGRNGFLIRPGDFQALADRIVRLLEDAPLRTEMAKANRERIRTSYMPEVVMSRFDQVYSRVIYSRRQ